jgi:hypothetical protein
MNMTKLTTLILEAAKNVVLSQALLEYFARNMKDEEVQFPLFGETNEEVSEQDLQWLLEHCEVMGTVGMVLQKPETVRRMMGKAFALVNGKRVVQRRRLENAQMCVCSAAESVSSMSHDFGFEDVRDRILGSAYCRSGPTSVKRLWEDYKNTPEATRDSFLQYGRVRAENILKRLLPEETAKKTNPQRGLR